MVQIVPVLTARGLVRTKQIEDNKLDRWRRIVVEAAEQSHRGRIPKIEPIVPLADVFSRFCGFRPPPDRGRPGRPRPCTRPCKESDARMPPSAC